MGMEQKDGERSKKTDVLELDISLHACETLSRLSVQLVPLLLSNHIKSIPYFGIGIRDYP